VKTPTHHYPTFERVTCLTVYQPAVAIRAVSVCVGDDGEMHTDELRVLGIELSAADCFEGPKTRAGSTLPDPRTLTPGDILNAGYRPDLYATKHTRHRLVVWSDEYSAPEVIDPENPECINAAVVAGPADRPAPWWENAIAQTAERIRKRLNIAEPAHVVAERLGAIA
jgi:hypothetical protein